ncbi:hypothetical protein EDD29_6214 [Actinocorallia herbida]|uniref:Uncharacterized protein n=1 Tax=Actinocorallia herbida TaxID=58109 RepID=A0A3N1D4R7_9ACTN|nr:hypothetical protein [Actinocorallia herbida]ROO88543.1 hypothetical protein EDD29_6214 [Actinocorallia herbida]
MGAPIEAHRGVEYRLFDHGLQPGGFTVTEVEGGFDVAGVCPGCGALVRVRWSFGAVGTKGWGRQKSQVQSGPRTITCDCGHTHAERPPENWDKGCGAVWQVELP